jgi:organic hydroperoxide reductase OsmC/OhrA
LAGCFTNDIIGEASRRGMKLNRVDVDIEVDWGPKDACAESIGFSTSVQADAGEKDIADLIHWADNDSTVSRTIRTGVPFTLSSLVTNLTGR